MKNSFNIFSNDLKNVGTNWVAIIILGGLILLPSLYAWLNILASWDPYGQTEQIPVAIVNEDEGEVLRDEEIDVGEELVEELKENETMEWHFLSREEAMDELEAGNLFSVIIIPEDFSEKLGTVLNAEPEKANVEYYVNEKLNAIAPKITEKGASVIVEEISSNFISTVNGVIFELFNDLGLELEENLPDIEKFENYVFEMEEKLPTIHDTLKDTESDAKSARDLISKAQGEMPKVESTVAEGKSTIDETSSFLQEAEDRLNEVSPKIKEDLAKAKSSVDEINSFMGEIQDTDINFDNVDAIKEDLEEDVTSSIQHIDSVVEVLQAVLDNMDSEDESTNEQQEKIEETISELNQIKTMLEEGQQNTEKIDTFLADKEKEVKDTFARINEITETAGTKIDAFINEYNETIEPTVLNEVQSAKGTLSNAREILVDIEETIPEVKSILNSTDSNLSDGEALIDEVLAEYPYVLEKITELADEIRNIQDEADINEIIELLQNDPEAERGFFMEPVELTEHKLFPIENYGSGMTPFYTILSLWVGGLLLISLLAVDVENKEPYTSREIYFGKLYFFIFLGILQCLIVTLGDLFIVDVQIANPVWFVVFGLFCSLIFITIIYTFVSILGDVGKALAIVMLVLQIAGSGGTYPVVLLPKFFQFISPFLPFTYAVDVMREALGGIVWSNVLFDLAILSIFGVVAIIFGTLLKKPINKLTNKTVEKSKESGVFH